jgi:hypothetical protein
MNTIETNKIIAGFLGQNKIPYEFPKFGNIRMDGDYSDTFFDNQLKFHSDWNWLMEVVKKCRLESNDEDSHWEVIYYSLTELNIEAVYNACVEFIKGYNNGKL